jgi:hypothetical protein
MESLWHDVRYSLRSLLKKPGLSIDQFRDCNRWYRCFGVDPIPSNTAVPSLADRPVDFYRRFAVAASGGIRGLSLSGPASSESRSFIVDAG